MAFLLGDPRFLSGGAKARRAETYDADPIVIRDDDTLVDEAWVRRNAAACDAADLATLLEAHDAQAIHRGRSSYHHRPVLNLFLKQDGEPTVGVELETIMRSTVDPSKAADRLKSNWFHFETDGSLGDRGWECITEPLPGSVARDPKTWIGLQNVLSPWLTSWENTTTGLHVHVGGFTGLTDARPEICPPLAAVISGINRRRLEKLAAIWVYYMVAGQSVTDAVFLRNNTGYCVNMLPDDITRIVPGTMDASAVTRALWARGSAGQRTIPRAADEYLQCGPTTRQSLRLAIANMARQCQRDDGGIDLTIPNEFTGHGTEINVQHRSTLEFRRGKGTLNGVSIHRMVEFTVLTVKYARRIVDGEKFTPSPADFAAYLTANTTSAALAATVGKLMKGEKHQCA